MTEWLISAGVLVVLALILPAAIRASKPSASRRKRFGAGSAGIGDALNGFFDPAKKVAIERIEQTREVGDHEAGQAGDKPVS